MRKTTLNNILFNDNSPSANILTKLEKDILIRCYYQQQQNINYIAEDLNISTQTVKTVMTTALIKLKNISSQLKSFEGCLYKNPIPYAKTQLNKKRR